MDLRGRLVIVTGGGSGLGAAAARRLAAAGGIVAVVDRNGGHAAAVAAEIGRQAQPVALDVTDADRSAALVEDLQTSLGAPAVLVNCAGVAPAGRIVGKAGPMPLAEFRQVLEVNLVGTFNMLRLVAAAMAAAPADAEGERGVIVNTASVAAFEGQIGQAAYAASKGGVASLTLPAARELAGQGIRVVAIAPGLFATPMLAGMPTAVQESLAQSVPFPRRLGDPAEFADLVAHIVQNRMLNGCVIRLDGALRMAPR